MRMLGYLFTGVNYAIYCVSRYQESKRNMLLLEILAKTSVILSFICLDSYTGVFAMCISLVLLFVSSYKETHPFSKIKLVVGYVLFVLIYILNLVFTFKGLSSLLVTTTSVLTLTSVWWLSPQGMRKLSLLISVLFMLYQLSLGNWAGLLEIAVFIANLTAYLKYRKLANAQPPL